MSGKLIVIEGIDGSGKETQTRLLVDWIKHHLGRNVSTFDFPSYHRSPFGRIIGRYLKGEFGDPVTMDPFETALLYAGDRMHSKNDLLAALDRGDMVVLNRYVPSNLAYGCAKLRVLNRHNERDALVIFNEQIEYEAAGLPKPDLVLVLDVESQVASNLIDSKAPRQYLEGEERDKYEMDTVFQRAVRQEYLRIAMKTEGWHIISCTTPVSSGSCGPRSIEEIQTELRELIEEAENKK
jgi:dTMP kinase